MNHWSERYIGTPFLERGRTLAGVDCWGLAHVIYPAELGIVLPSYTETYVSTEELAEIDAEINQAAHGSTWVKVTSVMPFDIAVFRIGAFSRHIGIVAEPGLMLHAHDDCAKIERYKSPKWEHRLTGFYRHVEMTLRMAS